MYDILSVKNGTYICTSRMCTGLEVCPTESTGGKSIATKAVLIVLVIIVVCVGVVYALLNKTKPLPTGEAAGVDLPPIQIPTSPKPINPYKERLKPTQPKPAQPPESGGQSWGP